MHFSSLTCVLGIFLAISAAVFASNTPKPDCVSFADASRHVGMAQCVRGTVLHVDDGSNGVTLLNFCKDAKACPFTVVVLPRDLKRVGDVRQLEGRKIEIRGTIEDFDGRAQIILRRTQQLLGDAAFLLFPRVPTDYDVERQPHNSAGRIRRPKAAKKTETKQGEPVSIEDPGAPQ